MKFKRNIIIILLIGVILIPMKVAALEDKYNLMFNKINDDPAINFTVRDYLDNEVNSSHVYNEYKPTSDGSYFLVGFLPEVSDEYDCTFVAKISKSGEAIYTKKLDIQTDQDDDGEGLVIIDDIAYIYSDPYLLKVDTSDGTLMKSVELQKGDLGIADSQNLIYIDDETLAMVTKNNSILEYNLDFELVNTINIDLDHNVELIGWRKSNTYFSTDAENNLIGMFFDFDNNIYYQFDKDGNIIKEVSITEYDEFVEFSFLKYKNGFALLNEENKIVYYNSNGEFQWETDEGSDEDAILLKSEDGNTLIKVYPKIDGSKNYLDTSFYNERGEKTNEYQIEITFEFENIFCEPIISLTKDNYLLIAGGIYTSDENDNSVSFISVYKNLFNAPTENNTNDNEQVINNNNDDIKNPKTVDNILINVITIMISLITIIILCKKRSKEQFNN